MTTRQRITSLDEAIRYFREMLEAHPQRDGLAVDRAVINGERREHSGVGIIHPARPDDTHVPEGELELPEVDMPNGPEADLAREIIAKLKPLKLLNPIRPVFGLGCGTGTLVTNFGIPINNEADNTPAYTVPLDEMLSRPAPDPLMTGVVPKMRERIAFLKDHTPQWMKIGMPDTQGPYNIAHAVIGEEALTAPYVDPEKFHKLMTRVTDLFIAVVSQLREEIGPERLAPWNRFVRLAECSVNMVSPQMYVAHILPHDLRICEAFGPVDMHTCSGPHVFHVTLANVPNIVVTEAGYGDGLTAGHTPVDEALRTIGDRPIALRIGQMLPKGEEFECIRRDFDLYADHPRLMFHYTGMYWMKADRRRIRAIHRQLDAYWTEKYGC